MADTKPAETTPAVAAPVDNTTALPTIENEAPKADAATTDGTAPEAAAPADQSTAAPAAAAEPAKAEQPAGETTQTSKADKRKSRVGDLAKKLQFWKKDKKEDAAN
ncbi:hypothetical protein CKM354_000924300 [Cercospora kikuchii]|uniref:Uncharacterized protein n=1 Tax=Cercospora kikuchii TaxID=84275 RepID=A0A9P3CKF9_9PEZI|nr:uncharacterized protein CKM354_000924300 [Cercospora kikuchii]GIZ46104.1 hypothetical protein CKM354_000924300 [Cercospora kikuchii]